MTTGPLPPHEPVFQNFLNAALGFNILKPSGLLEVLPPIRVLEALNDEPERRAEIIEATIGTLQSVVVKRPDMKRYADDISAACEDSPEIAKRFVDKVGLEFCLKLMEPAELYEAVMNTGWMMTNLPAHRGFAAETCELLLKNTAFGGEIETLYAIMKAISVEALFGDETPKELRVRMFTAVNRGCRRFDKRQPCEFMFDDSMGGVSFLELAQKLPVEVMARPFASYVDRLGFIKTTVTKPSVAPPQLPHSDTQQRAFGAPGPAALPAHVSLNDSDPNSWGANSDNKG